MSRRKWYPWYPADYWLDTQLLSDDADLLYRRILDALWINDNFLPKNHEKLSKISRFKLQKFKKFWPEICHFFIEKDDKISNKRLTHHYEHMLKKSELTAQSAKKRHEKSQEKKDDFSRSQKDANAYADADVSVSVSVLKDITTTASSSSLSLQDKPPEKCPYAEIVKIYHATLPMGRRVKIITDARKGHMRARWKNELQNLDAWRNYFEHVAESKWLTGQITGSRSGTAFELSLDYLINVTNLTNIYEGKYHR